MGAMMALQLAEQAMLDQPSCTIWAVEAVAAGATQRQWRIAAAIEEQHRLLAGSERLAERFDQRRREKALPLGLIAPHIDDANLGQLRRAIARRQVQPAIAALLDIDDGLERGR